MVAASDKAPARVLAPGDRFAGKYVLSRRIAVGGMGEIWVARNQMTSAEVALKVLRGDLDRKLEVEARFRHEAQLGAMLAHRNIVRVFDLLVEPDGTLVLVMELLRGETLRRYLKNAGTIGATEAVALMLPILSALQHAHEMGIVHRDLKPANILLAVDPDGQVTPKLLDFGIAKIPASGVKTMFGRVLGTPRYMSPEQIRADPKIDGRSDVFSAGTLLMEMMTGASPFLASSPSASLAAVLEQQVDPDPRIDPKLWLVIQRALAKRPYERFASAAEFSAALRKAVEVPETELQETLKRKKPPIERQPSFSDISPSFTDKEDDDDADESAAPPPPSAAVAAMARGQVGSIAGQLEPVETEGPRGETGAMSVPLRRPNRTARLVVGGALGVASLIAVIAVVGKLTRKPEQVPRTPITSAIEPTTESSAPNIPPPPSPDDIEILPTTGKTAAAKPPQHSTPASTPPPSGGNTGAATKPTTGKTTGKTGKKGVAATPDF